ncbi:unnamed protein product, partial [Chrysoparadoxa australica]
MKLVPWAKEIGCSPTHGCTQKICCNAPDEGCVDFDCGDEFKLLPWAKEISCGGGCNHLICCGDVMGYEDVDELEPPPYHRHLSTPLQDVYAAEVPVHDDFGNVL